MQDVAPAGDVECGGQGLQSARSLALQYQFLPLVHCAADVAFLGPVPRPGQRSQAAGAPVRASAPALK